MKYILIAYVIIMVFGCIAFYENNIAEAQPKKPYITKDVYLRGEVTDQMAASFGAAMKESDYEEVNEVVIHITSPGGSVYAGLQIYDYMKNSKAKIHMICEGYCMSMGAYLLAMGDIREAYPHSTIMFHQVHSRSEGTLKELGENLAEAQRLQNIVNEIIEEKSGLSHDEINKIEDHDNFMTPKQAKELNLIDQITGGK